MKRQNWTIFAAAAFLLVGSAAAQLPAESEGAAPEPLAATTEPAANEETAAETVAPPDALIGEVDPPSPDAESNVAADVGGAIDEADPIAEERAQELPRTASPLALIALLGAGSLGSALGLRFARRRR